VCVAYLRQKSRVNFRSTKVDAGKLKRKYLNRPWSTLAVKVLRIRVSSEARVKEEGSLMPYLKKTSILKHKYIYNFSSQFGVLVR
jgi:hypothetical protein